MRLVRAPGVSGSADALYEAASLVPDAAVVAAIVPGDLAWPRTIDKEEAIHAAELGLVALRAVVPGLFLLREGLEPPRSFSEMAALLTSERGYLVPEAVATRSGPAPRVPRARLLFAPFWTREERLWQLFRLFTR
jgi:hypothetical protein